MLSDELREQIQTYFRECVEARGLSLRKGQRVMIAEVARGFAESLAPDAHATGKRGDICVIEAGTGTGKTLAYTLGALPVAMHYGKALVISTATVALQEQLIEKDLPEIRANSSLDFEFALVKGRARYMCLSKLLLWEKQDAHSQNLFVDEMVFDDGPMATAEDIRLYRHMIEAWQEGSWDGERDHWPSELNGRYWSSIMANRQDCSGKKCPHYQQCSFFDARKKISDADVIVTNHDLVMADLFQQEGNILPPVDDAFYIFDEAHHLPDKALSHYALGFRVRGSQTWLLRSQSMLEKLQDEEFSQFLPQSVLSRSLDAVLDTLACLDGLDNLLEALFENMSMTRGSQESSYAEDKRYCRFEQGLVPEALVEKAQLLQPALQKTARAAEELLELLKNQDEQDGADYIMAYTSALANLAERAAHGSRLFASYAKAEQSQKTSPDAKWISLHDFSDSKDFQLSASPIQAGEVLNALLWEPCLSVLLTSATLTALGSFDFFIERCGLPERSRFFRIESPFNYTQAAKLVLPDFQSEPSHGRSFALEVANYIEKWQPLSMGTLVLFSSWAQMNEVSDFVDSRFHDYILKQGDLSKEEIIRQHKQRIDAFQHSMIFGLASFAEGIDLPGDYLSHVIICKLPFSVPTDPMAEALSEWVSLQGRNPFQAISVPEASLRLIQACGRLLRSESDSGRISILDKRLRSKSYGKQILKSLPPFTIQHGDD